MRVNGNMRSKGFFVAAIYAGFGIWLWLTYPACAPGHIAVFAPTMTLWACAQGYYTPAAPKP